MKGGGAGDAEPSNGETVAPGAVTAGGARSTKDGSGSEVEPSADGTVELGTVTAGGARSTKGGNGGDAELPAASATVMAFACAMRP